MYGRSLVDAVADGEEHRRAGAIADSNGRCGGGSRVRLGTKHSPTVRNEVDTKTYGGLMARYAIDAVTLVHLVANDVHVAPAHQLVAPNRIRSDALSQLYVAVRRGELTERRALEQHTRLTELKMRVLGDRVSRRTAWKLATEHDWEDLSAAEYVAVCALQADALVTVDPAMAARAAGIVPLASVSALRA